jgi:cobalt-precorrin-5B (C1)-methyltransferase
MPRRHPIADRPMSGHAVRGGSPKGDGGRGGRTGFTTGANAAAAARAAALGLVQEQVPAQSECLLPDGSRVVFAIEDGRVEGDLAHAVSVKDAGDDPDVTHGARLTVDVRRIAGGGGTVALAGGPGVGIVTRPGLGLPVGEAAINPVPRRNIVENVRAAALPLLTAGDGLEVTVSVPGGATMAERTLNARLGILGGISILGTTGIVRPYSTAAFRSALIQAVRVAARQGETRVVFTTGGRTESAAMAAFPKLPEVCFVQMGDFVKAAFRAALRAGMTDIVVGAMAGKLTKIAQGLPVTHAWRAPLDRGLVADAAAEAGAPPQLVADIRAADTARLAAERLAVLGLGEALHRALAQRAWASLRRHYPGQYRLRILACDFDGRALVIVTDDEGSVSRQ